MSAARLVSTFSIAARDAESGAFGVAVQSRRFNVGALVPWAEAGVGAVATQAFIEPGYGPRALDLLRAGVGAKAALEQLLAADPAAAVRQVAVVDARGEVAIHTGGMCIPFAGHRAGDGFAVQGNLLASDRVCDAMARSFERARGSFAGRLVAALEAGQAAGGDARGRESAALLVMRAVSETEALAQPRRRSARREPPQPDPRTAAAAAPARGVRRARRRVARARRRTRRRRARARRRGDALRRRTRRDLVLGRLLPRSPRRRSTLPCSRCAPRSAATRAGASCWSGSLEGFGPPDAVSRRVLRKHEHRRIAAPRT